MSINLSVRAQALIEQIGIEPQIILDIEGLDLIFGARPIFKTLKWDDPDAFWDDGLAWDGVIEDSRSRDYIQLAGTTNTITQQILPDKGSISSISTVNISIVDKDSEVSRAISFDNITDILGRKAIFALGFTDGAYPEDATPIFRGVVVDFYTTAGSIMISIASPESLKKQVLLEKFQTEVAAIINTSQTTITLDSTEGIYAGGNALSSYVRIDDELMRVDSILSSTQLSVTRAQLNTVVASHSLDASVETFYRLQGGPIDLALKLMLSSEGNEFFNSFDIPKSVNFVSLAQSIPNAIVFDYYDIQEKTGLVLGDKIKLNSPGNTGTYTVDFIERLEEGGSYIVVLETLSTEIEYSGSFEYRSKYNVLPIGLGMLTSEVDVQQFELTSKQFGANFVDYDLYIKDTIDDSKEFIDTQIFFPQGLYSLPRKARSSVKFIAPPFTSDIVPYVDVDSILNASDVKQRRSIHKYLYNTFVFRYEVDSIDDKYLAGKVLISADSLNRINVGKKQMKIESDGLRNTAPTTIMIDNVSRRLADRYQFAPVYFDDVQVNYKNGLTIEVGDILPFGGSSLQVTNLQNGDRGTPYALYEVTNKSMNIKTGKITLSLALTAFDINSRFSVISLASNIGSGSTTTRIRIELTNDVDDYQREADKWVNYSGQTVRVRSQDYTFDYESILVGIDPVDRNFLLLQTPLPSAPLNGYIIEPAIYQGDINFNEKFKLEFAHFVPAATITSVASASVFNVLTPSKLVVGSRIVVNSVDFSRDSFGTTHVIDDITGNTVTLNTPLSFTPVIGDLVNRTNMSDGQFPYILI
jgi:hypothetical protein